MQVLVHVKELFDDAHALLDDGNIAADPAILTAILTSLDEVVSAYLDECSISPQLTELLMDELLNTYHDLSSDDTESAPQVQKGPKAVTDGFNDSPHEARWPFWLARLQERKKQREHGFFANERIGLKASYLLRKILMVSGAYDHLPHDAARAKMILAMVSEACDTLTEKPSVSSPHCARRRILLATDTTHVLLAALNVLVLTPIPFTEHVSSVMRQFARCHYTQDAMALKLWARLEYRTEGAHHCLTPTSPCLQELTRSALVSFLDEYISLAGADHVHSSLIEDQVSHSERDDESEMHRLSILAYSCQNSATFSQCLNALTQPSSQRIAQVAARQLVVMDLDRKSLHAKFRNLVKDHGAHAPVSASIMVYASLYCSHYALLEADPAAIDLVSAMLHILKYPDGENGGQNADRAQTAALYFLWRVVCMRAPVLTLIRTAAIVEVLIKLALYSASARAASAVLQEILGRGLLGDGASHLSLVPSSRSDECLPAQRTTVGCENRRDSLHTRTNLRSPNERRRRPETAIADHSKYAFQCVVAGCVSALREQPQNSLRHASTLVYLLTQNSDVRLNTNLVSLSAEWLEGSHSSSEHAFTAAMLVVLCVLCTRGPTNCSTGVGRCISQALGLLTECVGQIAREMICRRPCGMMLKVQECSAALQTAVVVRAILVTELRDLDVKANQAQDENAQIVDLLAPLKARVSMLLDKHYCSFGTGIHIERKLFIGKWQLEHENEHFQRELWKRSGFNVEILLKISTRTSGKSVERVWKAATVTTILLQQMLNSVPAEIESLLGNLQGVYLAWIRVGRFFCITSGLLSVTMLTLDVLMACHSSVEHMLMNSTVPLSRRKEFADLRDEIAATVLGLTVSKFNMVANTALFYFKYRDLIYVHPESWYIRQKQRRLDIFTKNREDLIRNFVLDLESTLRWEPPTNARFVQHSEENALSAIAAILYEPEKFVELTPTHRNHLWFAMACSMGSTCAVESRKLRAMMYRHPKGAYWRSWLSSIEQMCAVVLPKKETHRATDDARLPKNFFRVESDRETFLRGLGRLQDVIGVCSGQTCRVRELVDMRCPVRGEDVARICSEITIPTAMKISLSTLSLSTMRQSCAENVL